MRRSRLPAGAGLAQTGLTPQPGRNGFECLCRDGGVDAPAGSRARARPAVVRLPAKRTVIAPLQALWNRRGTGEAPFHREHCGCETHRRGVRDDDRPGDDENAVSEPQGEAGDVHHVHAAGDVVGGALAADFQQLWHKGERGARRRGIADQIEGGQGAAENATAASVVSSRNVKVSRKYNSTLALEWLW